MKIEKNDNRPIDLDIKRLYLPFTASCNCSECGMEIIKNYDNDCLYYAKANTVIDDYIICPDCDVENEFQLRINISMELID